MCDGPGERARGLLRNQGREHPGRPRPGQGGRAQGVRQRLPPSRPRRHAGLRAPRDAAVPVPRLDLRARRLPPQGAALRARARVRLRQLLPFPRPGRDMGAVHLRERRPRGGFARRDARRPARDGRRDGHRPGQPQVPPPRRVRHRGQLEDRGRELPRVLPLPGRASRLLVCDQRRPGRLRARLLRLRLDPERPGAQLRPRGQEGRALRRNRRASTAARRSSSSRTSPSTSSRARRT